MERAPQSFRDFWPYYMSQHQDPTCRLMHFVGTTLGKLCIVGAFFVSPWLLLAAPVIGYLFAWIGHFAFEKNKPASWFSAKYAAWSFRGDMKMWRLMVTGRLGAELKRMSESSAF